MTFNLLQTPAGASLPPTPGSALIDAGKYDEPYGSKERIEEQLRIALGGHQESELWGEHGLIAATMRCVNGYEKMESLLDAAIEMLAGWCDAVKTQDASWDSWDEWYKDACYRPGPLRVLIDARMADIAKDEERCPKCGKERTYYDGWNCPTEGCDSPPNDKLCCEQGGKDK